MEREFTRQDMVNPHTLPKTWRYLILAGNYQEAVDWAKERQLDIKYWKYADKHSSILSIKRFYITVIGTFYNRRDSATLINQIKRPVEAGLCVMLEDYLLPPESSNTLPSTQAV